MSDEVHLNPRRPVAWRWWDDVFGAYRFSEKKPKLLVEDGYEEPEPLYAAPQKAPAHPE